VNEKGSAKERLCSEDRKRRRAFGIRKEVTRQPKTAKNRKEIEKK
jgi:hypothetical protein